MSSIPSSELFIQDLATDLRDGTRLTHLLEVLSGEQLPRPERNIQRGTTDSKTLLRIYSVVNVEKCLKFLATKLQESLVNIGSEDIVDGNLKVTMGLIWIMILRFRIEPIGIPRPPVPLPLPKSSSLESIQSEEEYPDPPSPPPRLSSIAAKGENLILPGGKTTLLTWCQHMLAPYVNVGIIPPVTNFSGSWRTGVVFTCLIHSFDSSLLPDFSTICRRYGESKVMASSAAREIGSSSGVRLSAPASSLAMANWRQTGPSGVALGLGHRRDMSADITYRRESGGSGNLTPSGSILEKSLAPNRESSIGESSTIFSMHPDNWRSNLQRAFRLAEAHMNVPQLLDVEDIVRPDKPDEMVIMTYVSELHWIMRNKAFPIPTLFRSAMTFSPPPVIDASTIPPGTLLENIMSQYAHHASALGLWINNQQKDLNQCINCLVSSEQPRQGDLMQVSRLRPIFETLLSENASVRDIPTAIEYCVKQLEVETKQGFLPLELNGSVPTFSETDGPHLLPQLGAAIKYMRQLRRSLIQNGESPPEIIRLEERHRSITSRYQSYSRNFVPDLATQLRSYGVWVQQQEAVVDKAHNELIGREGTGGMREEAHRLLKEMQQLAKRYQIAQLEEEALRNFEDTRRAFVRVQAIRAVIIEKLGEDAVGALGQASRDYNQEYTEALNVLNNFLDVIDTQMSLKMQLLRTSTAEWVLTLEKDVVNRSRASHTVQSPISPIGNQFSSRGSSSKPAAGVTFHLTPRCLITRGSRLIKIGNDDILSFISNHVGPLVFKRREYVSQHVQGLTAKRKDEQDREGQLITSAVSVTKAYCAQVQRVDDTLKKWKMEMVSWVKEGLPRINSAHIDNAWKINAYRWWSDRLRGVTDCIEGAANVPSSIAQLDNLWSSVIGSASTGLPKVPAAFDVTPHQKLIIAGRALRGSLLDFQNHILKAMGPEIPQSPVRSTSFGANRSSSTSSESASSLSAPSDEVSLNNERKPVPVGASTSDEYIPKTRGVERDLPPPPERPLPSLPVVFGNKEVHPEQPAEADVNPSEKMITNIPPRPHHLGIESSTLSGVPTLPPKSPKDSLDRASVAGAVESEGASRPLPAPATESLLTPPATQSLTIGSTSDDGLLGISFSQWGLGESLPNPGADSGQSSHQPSSPSLDDRTPSSDRVLPQSDHSRDSASASIIDERVNHSMESKTKIATGAGLTADTGRQPEDSEAVGGTVAYPEKSSVEGTSNAAQHELTDGVHADTAPSANVAISSGEPTQQNSSHEIERGDISDEPLHPGASEVQSRHPGNPPNVVDNQAVQPSPIEIAPSIDEPVPRQMLSQQESAREAEDGSLDPNNQLSRDLPATPGQSIQVLEGTHGSDGARMADAASATKSTPETLVMHSNSSAHNSSLHAQSATPQLVFTEHDGRPEPSEFLDSVRDSLSTNNKEVEANQHPPDVAPSDTSSPTAASVRDPFAEWRENAEAVEEMLTTLKSPDTEKVDAVFAAMQNCFENVVRAQKKISEAVSKGLDPSSASERLEDLLEQNKAVQSAIEASVRQISKELQAVDVDVQAFVESRWDPFIQHTEIALNDASLEASHRATVQERLQALESTLAVRKNAASHIKKLREQEAQFSERGQLLTGIIVHEKDWMDRAAGVATAMDQIQHEQTLASQSLASQLRDEKVTTGSTNKDGGTHRHQARQRSERLGEEVLPKLEDLDERRSLRVYKTGLLPSDGATDDLVKDCENMLLSTMDNLRKIQKEAQLSEAAIAKRLGLDEAFEVFCAEADRALKFLQHHMESSLDVDKTIQLTSEDKTTLDAIQMELESISTIADDANDRMKSLSNLYVKCKSMTFDDESLADVIDSVDSKMAEVKATATSTLDLRNKKENRLKEELAIYHEIRLPAERILNACEEIRVAVQEIAESATDSDDPSAIISSLLMLAKRTKDLSHSAAAVENSELQFMNSSTEAYLKDAQDSVAAAIKQTEDAGNSTIAALVTNWDLEAKSVLKSVDGFNEVSRASLLAEEISPEDAIITLKQKMTRLDEFVSKVGKTLQNLDAATKATVKASHEWEARDVPKSDRTHLSVSTSAEASPEAIQGRYIDIRTTVETLPGRVREGATFLDGLKEFTAKAQLVQNRIETTKLRFLDPDTEYDSSAVAGAEGELAELERVALNTNLASLLDNLHSLPGATTLGEDYPLILQSCAHRYEELMDSVQRVRSSLVKSNRAREAVTSYLGQATEISTWIRARRENLEAVAKDAGVEAQQVLSATADQRTIGEVLKQAASRSVDRQTAAASAEVALERYHHAYENLGTFSRQVISSCGPDADSADIALQTQESVSKDWEEMRMQMANVRKRLEWQRKTFSWAQRCHSEVLVGIRLAAEKISNRDIVLNLEKEEMDIETLESFIGNMLEAHDDDMQLWADQQQAVMKFAQELVAQTVPDTADVNEPHSVTPEDHQMIVALTDLTRESLNSSLDELRSGVDMRKNLLTKWKAVVTSFLSAASECEPVISEELRQLRDRLYGASRAPPTAGNKLTNSRNRLSSQSLRSSLEEVMYHQHLVVSGAGPGTSEQLSEWVQVSEKSRRVLAEVEKKMHVLSTRQEMLSDYSEQFAGGLAPQTINMSRSRLERVKESLREFSRLVEEEHLGIRRAQQYQTWHEELADLEKEVGTLSLSARDLPAEGPEPAHLESLFQDVVALESKVAEFVGQVKQDKDQQKRTSIDARQQVENDSEGHRLKKPRSLAALQVTHNSEERNSLLLQESFEGISRKVLELGALVRQKRQELNELHQQKTDESELRKIEEWCDNAEVALKSSEETLPHPSQLRGKPPKDDQLSETEMVVQGLLQEAVKSTATMEREAKAHHATLQRLKRKRPHLDISGTSMRLSYVDELLAAENIRLEDTKNFFAIDRAVANLTFWINTARSATDEVYATQIRLTETSPTTPVSPRSPASLEDESEPILATFEEVKELEDRLKVFETNIAGFMKMAGITREKVGSNPEAYISADVDKVKFYRKAIDIRMNYVNAQWDALWQRVNDLRGSSASHRLESEFGDAIDELWRMTDEVKQTMAETEPEATERWDELEDILDGQILVKAKSLLEMLEDQTSNLTNRKRLGVKQRELESEVRNLLEAVEERHTSPHPKIMVKRVARLQAEINVAASNLAKVVKKVAAAVAAADASAQGFELPAGEVQVPTEPECDALLLRLDTRYRQSDTIARSLRDRLASLASKSEDVASLVNMDGVEANWKELQGWKDNVRRKLLRYTSSSPLQTTATTRNADNQRPPFIRTDTARSGIPLPRSRLSSAVSTTPSLSPSPPPLSSFSPPLQQRSRSRQGSAAVSPRPPAITPVPQRAPSGPVRIFIPSPNSYNADPNDPLDVALANVVNQHPSRIQVERAEEPGRYWFGDALKRMCYCRLVRNSVMVRIGGGWQELHMFLSDHSAFEHRIPTVRSFSNADLTEDESAHGHLIELEPGEIKNPYAITAAAGSPLAARRPRLASALSRVANRDYHRDAK
ncbi:hypothetical protein DFS34DRAFT_653717 [Phlyctochytrium arcticum]|nr:hypothetical protein DFS34DRAFT_653717 [Phlyctochytrium arcticum]